MIDVSETVSFSGIINAPIATTRMTMITAIITGFTIFLYYSIILAIFHIDDVLDFPESIQMHWDLKSGKEWLKELVPIEKELYEEVNEYQNDKNPEELADILEVIYRISKLKGVSKDKLEEIRNKKSSERGAFEKNLFLIDTKED